VTFDDDGYEMDAGSDINGIDDAVVFVLCGLLSDLVSCSDDEEDDGETPVVTSTFLSRC